MVKVFIRGPVVKLTKVISLKGVRMDMVFGKDFRMIITWVNGETTKYGDTAFISGRTEIGMKVSGLRL